MVPGPDLLAERIWQGGGGGGNGVGLFSILKILANVFYQNPNFYEVCIFQSSTSLI